MTEAELLYRSFIADGQPPAALVLQYNEALRTLDIPEHRVTSLLVAARVNLVGAEYVLRLREPSNGLTSRALILATLVESTPDELTQAAPISAWFTLCAAPFIAMWRYVVGAAQLWWYDR